MTATMYASTEPNMVTFFTRSDPTCALMLKQTGLFNSITLITDGIIRTRLRDMREIQNLCVQLKRHNKENKKNLFFYCLRQTTTDIRYTNLIPSKWDITYSNVILNKRLYDDPDQTPGWDYTVSGIEMAQPQTHYGST